MFLSYLDFDEHIVFRIEGGSSALPLDFQCIFRRVRGKLVKDNLCLRSFRSPGFSPIGFCFCFIPRVGSRSRLVAALTCFHFGFYSLRPAPLAFLLFLVCIGRRAERQAKVFRKHSQQRRVVRRRRSGLLSLKRHRKSCFWFGDVFIGSQSRVVRRRCSSLLSPIKRHVVMRAL
jgi:hypothetical protein